MTVGRARGLLSALWLVACGPLVLLLVARSIYRFYGDDPLEVWGWVLHLVFPVLGLIVAAWSATGTAGDDKPVRSEVVFWGTLGLSLIYLATLYMVIAFEPRNDQPWSDVFRYSDWYLGFFQTIVVAALGKFFIENVH